MATNSNLSMFSNLSNFDENEDFSNFSDTYDYEEYSVPKNKTMEEYFTSE